MPYIECHVHSKHGPSILATDGSSYTIPVLRAELPQFLVLWWSLYAKIACQDRPGPRILRQGLQAQPLSQTSKPAKQSKGILRESLNGFGLKVLTRKLFIGGMGMGV